MNLVPLVLALAVSWYAGLFWVERSRRTGSNRPTLAKLLRLVELDLLQTLRLELTRMSRTKPKPHHEQKLEEVNHWLERLGVPYGE